MKMGVWLKHAWQASSSENKRNMVGTSDYPLSQDRTTFWFHNLMHKFQLWCMFFCQSDHMRQYLARLEKDNWVLRERSWGWRTMQKILQGLRMTPCHPFCLAKAAVSLRVLLQFTSEGMKPSDPFMETLECKKHGCVVEEYLDPWDI